MAGGEKRGIPTWEEIQIQFEGHAPEALVDAYRMLGEAEAKGKEVFESVELSNAVKLEKLAQLEREWIEAYQLILFWATLTSTGNIKQ